MSGSKNILITGRPAIGKTTLIKNVLLELKGLRTAGFYTEEITENSSRKGFGLVSIPEGRVSILSHVDIKSRYKVGRYGVNIEGFEKFLDTITFHAAELVVIDEIGKMECYSKRFKNLIKALLGSDVAVLATIALKGTPFIEVLKGAPRTALLEITERNRDTLAKHIVGLLTEGVL